MGPVDDEDSGWTSDILRVEIFSKYLIGRLSADTSKAIECRQLL